MNTLGIIAFFSLFAIYALGQEFSRRVSGIEGPSFFVRFHREAKPMLKGLIVGWVLVLAFTWKKQSYDNFKLAIIASTVVLLLISLVRAVEMPKDQKPPVEK